MDLVKTFIFGFFLGVFCQVVSANVKNRLSFLEMQVSRESFQTKSAILELRELISIINETKSDGGSDIGDAHDVEIKLQALGDRLEQYMQEQYDRTSALARAISEEKKMMRQMLKIIQDLASSNTESVLEIEQTVEQNEVERENFKKELELFKDEIRGDLNEMRKNATSLQEQLWNFDGNIIIQGAEKKKPCPKKWLLNGDTCYLYPQNEKLSWYGARIRCDDLGGKLVEPDTKEKMMYILSTVLENNVWIGATDDGHEGRWVWASSQKAIGSNFLWQTGQPNNLYGKQHCLEIGLALLNDEACLENNYYVCEKPVST